MKDLGIVTIGRNEGERLRRCLNSLIHRGVPVVYVDSASTDGSPELARSLGVEVVELDPSQPVNVPRGRNEGFARITELHPELKYVQFIDGDCELVDGWLERGREELEKRPDVCLVAGRRRELEPKRTVYNRLADMDWDLPLGEIQVAHGDMLIRVDAFRQVGGFDEMVLVSEDCDLCLRLRWRNWKLLRIDCEMTRHDMCMERFSQWWRRMVRTGYGYADGAYLHGRTADRYYLREVRGIVFWSFLLPLLSLAAAWPTWGVSLLLLPAGYLFRFLRIHRHALQRGWSQGDAFYYAAFITIGCFPLFLGLCTYFYRLVMRRPVRIIEYKGTTRGRKQSVAG